MHPTILRALAVQLATVSGERERNLATAARLIRANPSYDLYVLPELSTSGYDDAVFEAIESLAEDAHAGPSRRFFSRLAREVDAHIVYGFLRQRASGGYAISQGVAAPDGTLGCFYYDKMHLCNMGDCSEGSHGVVAGDRPATFDCAGFCVGLTLCYDIRFPELWRCLAWRRGCDLVLHPSAFVRDATFPTYHPFVVTRAQENGVYVLSVTHAGARYGGSIAAGPWLGPVPGVEHELGSATLGTDEDVLPLTVDLETLAAVRRAYTYREDLHPVLRPAAEREPEEPGGRAAASPSNAA